MIQTLIASQGTKLDLTHRQIAEALPPKLDGRAWTPQAVGNWWRGETAAPIELADDLARILQVTRDRMLKDIHAVSVELAKRKKQEAMAG